MVANRTTIFWVLGILVTTWIGFVLIYSTRTQLSSSRISPSIKRQQRSGDVGSGKQFIDWLKDGNAFCLGSSTMEVIESDESGSTESSIGSVRLAAISACWHTGQTDFIQTPYFDPYSLKAVSGNEISELSERFTQLVPLYHERPNLVRLRLLFEVENPSQFACGDLTILDANTGFRIGHGVFNYQNHISEGKFIAVDAKLRIWHDTPISVFFDIPKGKSIQKDLTIGNTSSIISFSKPRNTKFHFRGIGDYQQILSRTPTERRSLVPLRAGWSDEEATPALVWQAETSLSDEFFRMRMDEPSAHFTWLVTSWHHKHAKPIDPSWIGKENLVLEWFPNRERLHFHTNGLPMMPNKGVTDLLDVEIPYLNLDHHLRDSLPNSLVESHDVITLISDSAELEYLQTGVSDFPIYEPSRRTQVSLRSLLKEWERKNPGDQCLIDGANLTLEVKGPDGRTMLQRFKGFVFDLF